jgi:type I restriction enzyme, R subunit
MVKDTKAADAQGEELELKPYELSFYDALAKNQSAQDLMGVNALCQLARVLQATVMTEFEVSTL